MARNYFGTDGIRGTANVPPMTADTALKVGMAAGRHFTNGAHRHRVLIGKDTRLSGYMLEPALVAGFASVGMDVVLVGPMPTPAIAMLTKSLRCDLGVMLSASHNPFRDNGIKLFGPDGYKLSDAIEETIEALMHADMAEMRVAPDKLGRVKRLEGVHGRYVEFAKATFPRRMTLDGMKIVVDAANGAAYTVAPLVFRELGAEVVPLGIDPNGTNINAGCGSTDTDAMRAAVVAHGADIGIALDGDADRVIIADETGTILDGDQLMALVARFWAKRARLRGDAVVATVMSNLGFERFLGDLGLRLERTPVGDRYVVERMRELDCNVGGEQSGHIVLSDFATTGDGVVAALQVMAVMRQADRPLSEVGRAFEPIPQLLTNVRYEGGSRPLEADPVRAAIADGEARLGNAGRLVIRPSGTEPVIRVMVEGEDETLVGAVANDIAGAIREVARR